MAEWPQSALEMQIEGILGCPYSGNCCRCTQRVLRRAANMKHHYLPQFLQRAWAGPDGKVTVFRIDLAEVDREVVLSRTTPEYTGFEHNLWSLSQDQILGMKRDAVEM